VITSLILRTATRMLLTVMLLFSLFLLLRGHNEPGGGFVGGLVGGSAFVLYAIAFDVGSARRALHIDPRLLIGVGLLAAALSGILSVMRGLPFMTGLWGKWTLPGGMVLELGTPLLFDIGVYLVVMGVTLTILLSLMEE
jgi:Multisubunit Na+/H+ antiporter, MnhB subunit